MVRSNSFQWASGDAYELCDGRWSGKVAEQFITWLRMPDALSWVDIGCGTGQLTKAVLRQANPQAVTAVDLAEGFIEYARANTSDERARFEVGDACALPLAAGVADCAISGLVLNFVRSPVHMLREMHRILKRGGTAASYVWDYASHMQLFRVFWDTAAELDGLALHADGKCMFPICQPDLLRGAVEAAGFGGVDVRSIDVAVVFRDFAEYWAPFVCGQEPGAMYAMSLSEKRRSELRKRLSMRIMPEPDGSIRMIARAWAIRAQKGSF